MNDELDYAEMLEIPVNTVKVVKKKSIFSRKKEDREEDLKAKAMDSVNGRMDDYVYPEDLTSKSDFYEASEVKGKRDIILIAETAAACALALGIFATNMLVPNTAINTFINYFSEVEQTESAYSEFDLFPVVSDLSDAEVTVSESGVITFTDSCAVYPVCQGTVSAVYQNESGIYTVEIAHTSLFSSVVTGVDTVYYSVGDSVKSGVPIAYTNGENQVTVSMYNEGLLLNNYSLSGTVPVWNS
ncbi:MAG: hypothetical protein E7370_03150 [Clostridiales bacterium]|nr:hypothetical protein [Clostridiales bacterium]